jgi:hypothetical protein
MGKEKKQTNKLDWMDINEIASSLCEVKTDDADTSEIEDAIYKKYDVSYEQFHNIVADIFDRIDFGVSPLTQKAFVGISNENKNMWLAKKEHEAFIQNVIDWMTGGDELKPDETAFVKTAYIDEKPVYEFTLTPAEHIKQPETETEK